MPECGVCRRRWWDERGEAEWARQRCNVMVVEVEQPQLAPLSLPLLRMSTEECSRAIRLPAGQRERLDSTRLANWAVEHAPHLTPHASRCTASQPASAVSKIGRKFQPKAVRVGRLHPWRLGADRRCAAQRSTLALFGLSFVVREGAASTTVFAPRNSESSSSSWTLAFFSAARVQAHQHFLPVLVQPRPSTSSLSLLYIHLDRTRRPCRRS